MERRQVDLGIVEILESVRREQRPKEAVRSRTKPKREQRRTKLRPGRRERMEKKGGRSRGGSR